MIHKSLLPIAILSRIAGLATRSMPVTIAVALFLTPAAHADFASFFKGIVKPVPQTPHPAIVQVQVQEQDAWARGSGTLIASNEQYGWILTNWHVVRGAVGPAYVAFPGGFQTQGKVVKTDQVWDLALIVIPHPPVAPMPLAPNVPQVGESLTIAGYGSGDFRAARGRCTNFAAPDVQHPQEMIDISVAARQGDSGGPIVNDRSELAGVLFGAGQGATTGTHVGRVRMFLLHSEPSTDQIAAGQNHTVATPRQPASAHVLPLPADLGAEASVGPYVSPAGFPSNRATAPQAIPVQPAATPTYEPGLNGAQDPFAAIEHAGNDSLTAVTAALPTAALPGSSTAGVPLAVPSNSGSQAISSANRSGSAATSNVNLGAPQFVATPTTTESAPVEKPVSTPPGVICDPVTGVCTLPPSAQVTAAIPSKRRLDDTSTFLIFVGAVGAFVYFAPRESSSKTVKQKGKTNAKRKPPKIHVEDDEE